MPWNGAPLKEVALAKGSCRAVYAFEAPRRKTVDDGNAKANPEGYIQPPRGLIIAGTGGK